ncbi:zinc ribbon domain-containing protein [Nocardioides bruguierae]|uniref:Zinc ribbon domain-containing protein n=1 Tax=Nocardioides bruguierae TaxID=2945102 RepID=A0A9X2D7P0_9ACTN|nr:zinc ribbon domain-containing protein [Nocardioides bruguierae]MCM0620778.1 zinc ribbon domain-containing protein [Nocardioides bruguierae]
MTRTAHPLPQTGRTRTTLRVVGGLLLVVGLCVAGLGLWGFVADANGMTSAQPSMEWSEGGFVDEADEGFTPPGGFAAMGLLAVGGFMTIGGLAALSFGTLGAQSRYVAGETMPTVKQSAAYLSDGRGVLGIGQDVDQRQESATGPYCRQCGTRNDEAARFCDSCGTSLA